MSSIHKTEFIEQSENDPEKKHFDTVHFQNHIVPATQIQINLLKRLSIYRMMLQGTLSQNNNIWNALDKQYLGTGSDGVAVSNRLLILQ